MFKIKKQLCGMRPYEPLITLEEFVETPSAQVYLTNYRQTAALARALNKIGIKSSEGLAFDIYDIPNHYERIGLYRPRGYGFDELLYKDDWKTIYDLAIKRDTSKVAPYGKRSTFLFENIDLGLNGGLVSAEDFFSLPHFANIHCRGGAQISFALEVFGKLGHTWITAEPLNQNVDFYANFGDMYLFNDGRWGVKHRHLNPFHRSWAKKVSDRNCTSFEFDEVDFSSALDKIEKMPVKTQEDEKSL